MSPLFALLLAVQAPEAAAVPTADEVKAAIEDQVNAACAGEGEADQCGANRATAEVRGLSCQAHGEYAAACRYERRTRSQARGQGPWEAKQTHFSFDVETGLWFADEQ